MLMGREKEKEIKSSDIGNRYSPNIIYFSYETVFISVVVVVAVF